MVLTRKDRKHSGRIEVYSEDEDYPTQFTYYDDWTNYRDGLRFGTGHYKMCHPPCEKCKNKLDKIKKQIELRKAKQNRNI